MVGLSLFFNFLQEGNVMAMLHLSSAIPASGFNNQKRLLYEQARAFEPFLAIGNARSSLQSLRQIVSPFHLNRENHIVFMASTSLSGQIEATLHRLNQMVSSQLSFTSASSGHCYYNKLLVIHLYFIVIVQRYSPIYHVSALLLHYMQDFFLSSFSLKNSKQSYFIIILKEKIYTKMGNWNIVKHSTNLPKKHLYFQSVFKP